MACSDWSSLCLEGVLMTYYTQIMHRSTEITIFSRGTAIVIRCCSNRCCSTDNEKNYDDSDVIKVWSPERRRVDKYIQNLILYITISKYDDW